MGRSGGASLVAPAASVWRARLRPPDIRVAVRCTRSQRTCDLAAVLREARRGMRVANGPAMRRLSSLLVVAVALLEGCAGDSALGQGDLNANCAPSDLVCAMAGFDAPIAEGASLPIDVNVDLTGSGAPEIQLVSGNPDVFSVEGQRLRGGRTGVAALLMTTPDSVVLDFVHVWVAQPSALLLHRRTENGEEVTAVPGKVQLLVDDELPLSAELYAKTQRLLGEPEATWAVDHDCVQILEEGTPNRRRLVARAQGETTLKVTANGLETTLDLEVLP